MNTCFYCYKVVSDNKNFLFTLKIFPLFTVFATSGMLIITQRIFHFLKTVQSVVISWEILYSILVNRKKRKGIIIECTKPGSVEQKEKHTVKHLDKTMMLITKPDGFVAGRVAGDLLIHAPSYDARYGDDENAKNRMLGNVIIFIKIHGGTCPEIS